jgi:predicted NBD/HSP70 family sugar kinase
MIIGIDVGGTKTLVAVFAENGKLLNQVRFETNHNYELFLQDLKEHSRIFETQKAKIACAAIPGALDTVEGTVKCLGNLPWKNEHIVRDFSKILGIKKVYIENDANLAALAEARALPKPENLVLYITLSTGIGSGIILKNKLLPELAGSEAGQMIIHDHEGNETRWEDLASGKALVKNTGKRADELEDSKLWQEYAKKVSMGLQPVISTLQPQKIVLGGGVGIHLGKFKARLTEELEKLNYLHLYETPKIVKAHYGEMSVIHGCYEYAKDKLA